MHSESFLLQSLLIGASLSLLIAAALRVTTACRLRFVTADLATLPANTTQRCLNLRRCGAAVAMFLSLFGDSQQLLALQRPSSDFFIYV